MLYIKVLWFPHYMRLRQFTGFNPVLIPRYQITHPSLPPLPSNPLLLLTPATQTTQILAFRAHRQVNSSGFFYSGEVGGRGGRTPASKKLGVFLLGGRRGGIETLWWFSLINIDNLKNRKRGWVLALRFKALCCFKVLFGSQYRLLTPL